MVGSFPFSPLASPHSMTMFALVVLAVAFVCVATSSSSMQANAYASPVQRALDVPVAMANDVARLTTLLATLSQLPSASEQDRAIQDARPVFIRVDKDKLMQLLKDVPEAVKDRVVVASLQANDPSSTSSHDHGFVAAISPYFGSGMILGLIVLVLALVFRAFNPYRALASDAAIIAHVMDKLQDEDRHGSSQDATPDASTPTSTSACLGKPLPMPTTSIAVV
ncbi:hypothetical protein AaE_016293 [Aphanomyces astaci]|uniref:Uncharacterized protein n=1 Tax=Aphanomyces astaci TaxID=112090 RepID=A0A6A4YX66_APHAT|nr:hypothetical protein AaE_016293 [Aphanomyces astaci]